MIQLRVERYSSVIFLDLYDTDPPKLTLSIEDITTTDTTTAFSRQFRLPNSDSNDRFFKTAFHVNGRDFDITRKWPASILVNGNEFIRGEIRLQNVYENNVSNKIDYEVIFLGDVRNFASSVGEGALCELDFSDLAHSFTLANVTASWDAYPETPSTQDEGLFSGSIIYPLVDFGNNYNDDNDLAAGEVRIENGSSNTFIQSSTPLNINRLRPCIKAKDIWDKIFANSGFEYDSNFLNSSLFRHLYVGAWGDAATTGLTQNFTAYNEDAGPSLSAGFSNYVIPITTATNNLGDFDFPNNEYDVPANGNYDFVANINGTAFWIDPQDPVQKSIQIKVDIVSAINGIIGTNTATVVSSFPNVSNNFSISANVQNYTLVAGDTIEVRISDVGGSDCQGIDLNNGSTGTRWAVTQDLGYNVGTSLSCDYKQIDFIKDIITKFRLVMAPDKLNPNKFVIEPWQQYIGTGDVYDWTEKLDNSKDTTLTPIFFTQKNDILFEDKEGDDFLSVYNQETIGEVYGTLNFSAESELLKDERKITTKFTPLASKQIEGATTSNNGMDNTIIPQIHAHEAEVNSSGNALIHHNPVKPGVRLFWYNGIKHTGRTIARDNTWYLTDGTDTDSFTKFPMISQWNEWGDRDDSWNGIDTLTQDLNWQRETSYVLFNMANPFLGGSVYDYYWANYINTLYDPWSRRLTGYFILDGVDLFNFSFDDVIFLKDAYYYVEKIYDAVLGDKSKVKVDLIKLNNYYPNTANFIPPGLMWQEATGIANLWENVTTNWEDI